MKYGILIIADNRTSVDNIKKIISGNFDVEIFSTVNNSEANILAEKHKIDLVIHEIGKHENAAWQDEQTAAQKTPVIVITDNVPAKDSSSAINDSKLIEYIRKPYKEQELTIAVKFILRYIQLERNLSAKLDDSVRALSKEIESRKTAEQYLRECENKIIDMNAAKDKLFSIISGDMKSPINIIMQHTNLLRMNYDRINDPQRLNYIERISESVHHTCNLIEDLLAWSRTQTGTLKPKPEKIALSSFIFDNVYAFNSKAKAKQIDLKTEIDDDLFVFADPEMFATIIKSIVSNAVKYTLSGGEISIYAASNTKMVDLIFKDTGIGIPQEKLTNLFSLNGKCDNPGTENESGMGLGLILSKELLSINGGKINITSENEQGTTVEISLPIAENI